MADTRSLSWMWKTWNCGQTGQGRHGDVGPVAVRGVCSLTTGPSCPRAPRGAPPGRWTRPGLSPGLPHVQVSLEGPATRRPREALWALSVLAPPATPPGCALGGGAGLGSLETWGWRGGDWKGCWKLGAQEGSRQSSRHPPTLKGGGEGLLGPGCSRNRPMRPGRPQLFMRDGTRGGSGTGRSRTYCPGSHTAALGQWATGGQGTQDLPDPPPPPPPPPRKHIPP